MFDLKLGFLEPAWFEMYEYVHRGEDGIVAKLNVLNLYADCFFWVWKWLTLTLDSTSDSRDSD